MNKALVILLIIIVGFIGACVFLDNIGDENQPHFVKLKMPTYKAKQTTNYKPATMMPGRVVELSTSKGNISFVLFEKDCPKTTKRIIDLVNSGNYNEVSFTRVEKGRLIQTEKCNKKVSPMGCEICKGLTNAKGTVGMARVGDDYNSNTSEFYILIEPWPQIDYQYTVFGRLIKGMDIAMKINCGDVIKSAKVRPLTAQDKKDFNKVLTIEAERKTE